MSKSKKIVEEVIETVRVMTTFVALMDNGMSRLFESRGNEITDKRVKYRAYRISRDISKKTGNHTSVESINVFNV